MSAGLRARLLELSKVWLEKDQDLDPIPDNHDPADAWQRGRARGYEEAAIELAAALDGQGDAAALPIHLNKAQECAIKEWAADDRLWTTQETVEFNLRTFALVILKAAGDAAPRVAASFWQDIATAPKDTDILLWNGWSCQIGKFSTTFGVWMTGPREPEAWMPLPEPPATSGSGDEAREEQEKEKNAGLPR